SRARQSPSPTASGTHSGSTCSCRPRCTPASAGCPRRSSSATASARCASLAESRFLPGDPRVSEPYRLTPQLALRVAVLGFLALTIFAVLFLRLWALQVLSGDKYLAQANNNRVRKLPIDAQRGLILDRDGRVLVKNTLGTSIELWPADLPKNQHARLDELEHLAAITGVHLKEIDRRIRE